MSQTPSYSQKMMDVLNEIDLVAFVSLSSNPISTIFSVKDSQTPTSEIFPNSADKAPPVYSPSLDLNEP
uniref:Putative ovule protein n=1 Tax=Solanum chacoense TaxID=4108 RepID=A0A0V0GIJ5_SOLCH